MGLQLTRRPFEGSDTVILEVREPCSIEVRVTYCQGKQVGLKISAPQSVEIIRKELQESEDE
jgi:sRNA-binding carbon storage regulator CsrA